VCGYNKLTTRTVNSTYPITLRNAPVLLLVFLAAAQPTRYAGLTRGTHTEDPPTSDRPVPQESPADPAREGDRRYH